MLVALNFAKIYDKDKLPDARAVIRMGYEDKKLLRRFFEGKVFFEKPEDKHSGTVEAMHPYEQASLFQACMSVEAWMENKQVYSFDITLEEDLLKSESIEVPVDVLEKLPYPAFYIEFPQNGILKTGGIDGAYVFVRRDDECFYLIITGLVPGASIEDINYFVYGKSFDADESLRIDIEKPFYTFVLNALLYLSSANADIRENEVTKKTYRKSMQVRNKFSEIRKWDCGYRYGANVRLYKKKKQEKEAGNEDAPYIEPMEDGPVKTVSRRPVTPHTRRAHYRHYHVGKGRKEIILKWIPPTHVGFKDFDKQADVAVIHKVKGE